MASSHLPQCAVYAIVSPSGRSYVGGSTRHRVRWSQHRTLLRTNGHHAKALQAEWDQYGEAAFRFVVLEAVEDPAHLLEREQYHIERALAGGGLLNESPGARVRSAQAKANLSAIMMGNTRVRGQRRGPDMKAKISALKIGEKNPNAKLTEADVVAIRRRAESGESRKGIAATYAVSAALISRVVNRVDWRHVP